ncbi:MAG: cell wall-binding repeat-containing protein [Atopobiaceae bacterium]|jgi:putative cell wall-binding protein|nr:cell wall-binding repeat-containing protein [Atopobiaceae bacterium]MCI2173890.1 cell wall-binding repeat-containing protein [Atopobiaceae bacterium]MCI2208020.1 cell wall-binding repeat-containing protein [Atopobiaceae bacterium]
MDGWKTKALALAFVAATALALAPATALAADKEGPTWTRIYGTNELDTMEAIASDGWDRSDVAVIARNDDYHDALSATSLAGLEDAPILLTDRWHLSTQTAEAIKSLGVTRVYIAGGDMAISKDVESSLEGLGVTCTRVYGSDPAGTARAVMERGSGSWGGTVIVARGNGFEDALSVSPSSYSQGYPIVLCEGDHGNVLSQGTLDDIRSQGFTKAVIVGGTGAVSAGVEGQLASAGVTSVSRLGGQNQYDTSALIGEWEVSDLGMSRNGMGVATARKYQDALTGGAYCGRKGSILVLADDGNRSAAQTCYRTPLEADETCVTHGEVFGGWMAVSEETYDWLHRDWIDERGHYERSVQKAAWDETVVDRAAYDESYVVTAAYDETVSAAYTTYVASDGTSFNSIDACQDYCIEHDCGYGSIDHPAVVKHHDAVMGTRHHDAVTHVVHHDAVTVTERCSSDATGATYVRDSGGHWTW